MGPKHGFGLESIYLDGFSLLGGGQRHSHRSRSLKVELPGGEGMFCHFSLVSRQIFLHCRGLVQLKAVGIRVGRERRVMAERTVIGDVHPNGRVVPWEVAWFKVPTLDS